MKIIPIIVSFFFLCSCGTDENEVIDLSKRIPTSEKYANDTLNQSKVQEVDTLAAYFDVDLVPELNLQNTKISWNSKATFPERFSAKKIVKLKLSLQNNDTLYFSQWIYKDSLKTMNALFNWMDCFGEKCKQVKYQTEMQMDKKPFLLFINDTSMTMISCKSTNLSLKNWQMYLEKYNLTKEFDNVVEQKIGQKAKWYNFSKKTNFQIIKTNI